MRKDPKRLWEKMRAVLLKKSTNKDEIIAQNYFHKVKITEGKKIYTGYSLSDTAPPFLIIRNLRTTLDKDKLLESCKKPVDFTGNISIHFINVETWPGEEILAFYCYRNLSMFE